MILQGYIVTSAPWVDRIIFKVTFFYFLVCFVFKIAPFFCKKLAQTRVHFDLNIDQHKIKQTRNHHTIIFIRKEKKQ